MFAVYNANGREIGSYDSQPTKFAARELLLRGTLASTTSSVGRRSFRSDPASSSHATAVSLRVFAGAAIIAAAIAGHSGRQASSTSARRARPA